MTDLSSRDYSSNPALRAPLPPEMRAKMWQKGQSGNPGGKRPEYFEMQRIAREASPAAAKRLVEMAYLDAIDEDGNLAPLPINADRRIVSWAVDKLMERAWGKPKEYDPLTEKDPNKPKFDPRLLSPQQLDIVEYALKLMVQATRAPGEATVIEQPAADQAEEPSVTEGEDYEDVQVSE
jgi:hypothetical protein